MGSAAKQQLTDQRDPVGVPSSAVQPVDDRVAAATLVSLPGMTPVRLDALLALFGEPVSALAAVMGGRSWQALATGDRELGRQWAAAADPEAVARILEHRRCRVLVAGAHDYPIDAHLPGRPPVLFAEGDRPEVFEAPRVAIVGTRAASPHGLADARELGAFLAAAGVTVVSGLAIGVDAAAHIGALQAGGGVVGVVATGLDIVYPRRHGILHRRVRNAGLLVGEHWLGTAPIRARFPVRNRIIAALADVVVVVEATTSGGARITAERALDYGRPVLAMPGSRRNPAAAGCNALLADGAQPLLEPSDVLLALGLTPGARREWDRPHRPPPTGDAAVLERALAGEAAHPDQLSSRTGLPPERVATGVEELVRLGRAELDRGFVWPV
jgi:DNA processing protein